MRIAIQRPELIRSWAMGIAGCFAPDYVWHDLDQVWQTPGVGEEAVAGMASLPITDRASMFESLGMTPDIAVDVAEAGDETMGRCILSLYRSAAQPAMARLGGRLGAAAARPGLVIIPTEDEYTGGEARARWSSEQAKAEVAVLQGLGHWWMIQDPAAGAAALQKLWGSLTSRRKRRGRGDTPASTPQVCRELVGSAGPTSQSYPWIAPSPGVRRHPYLRVWLGAESLACVSASPTTSAGPWP